LWYVGIASDEAGRANSVSSKARSGERAYPLVEWGVTEKIALEYCLERGFSWGGLYDIFPRVSCYCCPLQPLAGVRKVRKYFPELWEQMLEWDRAIEPKLGFNHYLTVEDLEARFAKEDLQEKNQVYLFEEVDE
jgi:3'-phosphoadenosine 5'-phosphosulfate sulfotransferase (PAPS reductase)/FAD synthetase